MLPNLTKRLAGKLISAGVIAFLALYGNKSFGQCNLAVETVPTLSVAVNCNLGSFRLGSGAYIDLGVAQNTYYEFTWSNNGAPNINGFCAAPQNGSGTTFNTNQTAWFSGSTTTLRVSSNRSSSTWNGTSAIMSYRHTQPANATATASASPICIGSSVSITGGGGTNGILYYQGTTSNGVNTSTPTNPTSITPGVGTATYYWRANNNGCWGNQGSAIVTVNPNSVGGSAAAAPSSICVGSSVDLSLSGHLGSVGNWEYRLNGGAWTNMGYTGSTSFTTAPLPTVGTYDFRVAVVNNPCNGEYSNPVTVTVVPTTVSGTTSAALSNFCAGGNTTVSLSGNVGNVTSWERQINGGAWVNIGNTGLSTISTGILAAGTYQYRANVQNAPCPVLQSSISTITVDAASVGGNAAASGTLICDGDNPTISLNSNTGAVLYWERQVNGGGFNNIGNVGSTSFSTGALTPGVYDYRAVVKNGSCAQATSNSVTITVSSVSIGGTAVPNTPQLCQGGGTNINLSGQNGTVQNWEYQVNGGGWSSIGNAGLTVIASGTLNTPGNNEFRSVIKNGGCPAVTSTPAQITVDPTSVGGNIIADFNSVCEGGTVNMILQGHVGSILYWERQFNGGGWANIGNGGSTLLATQPLTPSGVYEYRAVIQSGLCPSTVSASVAITVNPYDDASFTYSASVFCQGANNPSPSIALGGGSFTASPAGLDIDPSTGIINLNASMPGSYTITHTTSGICPSTANQAVTVVGSGNAGFSYGQLNYCLNSNTNPIPTTATAGGAFSSSPAGLIFTNTATGEVDLTTSVAGSYYVSYTLPGVCPSTQTQTVNLVNPGVSTFAYANSSYCLGTSPNPSPSVTVFGGTYSAVPAGLVFTNNQTGTIDLNASVAGNYVITYNSGGPCPTTSTQSISLNAVGNPTFAYGAATYCKNTTNPTPTVTTAGGVFTSTPAGLNFVSASTGEVNLTTSQAGTYSITYTLGGACPATQTHSITIVNQGNSAFAYANNSYCQGAPNPTPTVAAFGGTFTSSPFGLIFTNNQTGTINLNMSSAGTYTVTYNSGGTCPTTSTQTITINAAGDPLFFYSASNFCQNASNPTPFVSTPGGGFTSSPAGLLFVSPSTGEISLAASIPGGYVVTYNTGGLCPMTYSQNVLITANANATFNYPQGTYCQFDANPTPNVAQIGGTFTSTAGLVFENQFTGKINLAASTVGTYTVTYTVPGTCTGTYTQQVIINAGSAATLSYGGSSFCSNGTDPVATVTPAGGTFQSSPLGLSIDAVGTIDVSASVPGAYAVSYTASGLCGTTATANVIVVTAPQAFIQPINSLCTGSSPVTLTASPSGGTWSGGAYVNASGVFDPAVSGAGTFPVNYVVTGNGGCNASASYNVVVNTSPAVTITPAGPFCSNDSIQVLTASPLGGIWSGNPFVSINGLFFPAEAGPGVYPVMYTVNNSGCTGSTIASIQVLNSPIPVINAVAPVCASGAPIGLTSNVSGGTWSGGPYVNAMGTFNPALAAVGNNSVTYTVTNGTCTAQSTAQIAVNGNPNVNIITPTPFCQNDSPEFISVNITGGVFTGTGSYINGFGLFNPSLASLGNNTVIYTVTNSNGCVGADTANVLVNANPDATITYPGIVCVNAGTIILMPATNGGTWSGGAYINNGVFDPAVAGPGSHTVNYNVTTAGCSSSSSIAITVDPTPQSLFYFSPNGLLVYFNNISINSNSWSWNFGDGSPEVTDENPTHVFPDNGLYQVRLIATNACGSDTLIYGVIVNKALSVDENTPHALINLFPNPADQFIQLTADMMGNDDWALSIVDLSGKTVMTEVLYSQSGSINKTIDVSVLRPGVYFVNIRNSEKAHTIKFIKQ